MKKILIIACIIIAGCSKKNKEHCYRCEISGTPRVGPRTLDTCSDVPSNLYHFQDAYGNDQAWICDEK